MKTAIKSPYCCCCCGGDGGGGGSGVATITTTTTTTTTTTIITFHTHFHPSLLSSLFLSSPSLSPFPPTLSPHLPLSLLPSPPLPSPSPFPSTLSLKEECKEGKERGKGGEEIKRG